MPSMLWESAKGDSVVQEVKRHPAWVGCLSGLAAEKLLRGKQIPYLFLLRSGESETNYYVTFLLPNLSVKHQPFRITVKPEGWYYESIGEGGPFPTASFEDVLHLIMQCGRRAPVAKDIKH